MWARNRRVFILLFLWLCPLRAQAVLEVGSDLFVSGLFQIGNELSLRSHNYAMIGGSGISVGGVLHYEPQHSYLTDLIYGGGIRIGSNWFVQIDAGLLQRTFEGVVGQGFAATLIIGKRITKNFRLSFPIIVKRITSGLDARWIVDFSPTIGLGVMF